MLDINCVAFHFVFHSHVTQFGVIRDAEGSVYIPLFWFFICSHQMKNGISTSIFHFSFFIHAKILKLWRQQSIFHFLLISENRKYMRLHINSIFHREWKMENEKWKIEWRHRRNSIFHFMRLGRPLYCINLRWYLWLWRQKILFIETKGRFPSTRMQRTHATHARTCACLSRYSPVVKFTDEPHRCT